ncbi:hypothetical protein [uncultured Treponema sp.]|uniref:hypothetical protein n=1 Tax=uncultured Treponema sp. TaxID=162155 RepID=UPI00261D0E16|nr:hypothetical protein [uncultured Treponema sp.]
MSDSIIKLIICAFGGLLASEGVVRLIGKFKYGIWAAILPPATWLEIIKKYFVLLLIVFFTVTFALFFSGIIN